jgi:hypothetical protein
MREDGRVCELFCPACLPASKSHSSPLSQSATAQSLALTSISKSPRQPAYAKQTPSPSLLRHCNQLQAIDACHMDR